MRLRVPRPPAGPTVAALLVFALAGAAAADPTPLLYGNESAAATDDAIGFLVNPAAGGIRYPMELTFGLTRPEESEDLWIGAFSTQRFGVSTDDLGSGVRRFSFAFAGGEDRLRLGARIQWLDPNDGGAASDYALGALSRPVPWLSLGGVAEHLGEPSVRGTQVGRGWTAALALRPLALQRAKAFTLGPRFTLSSDVSWTNGQTSNATVRLGGEVEVVHGVALRGSYENHAGWQAGVALFSTTATAHARSAYDPDNHRVARTGLLSVHRGEERTVMPWTRKRVATLRLGGTLADEPAAPSLLGGEGGVPSAGAHLALERALEDPLTRGVLIELRGVSGMAQLEELRPRIQRLRAAGKPVVAYLPYGGERGDLFLASACDRVVASEEAFFAGLGLRIERRSYGSALERIGLHVDRASIGRYKSAYRQFSQDSTPPADKESIAHLLDSSQEQFVSAVLEGRRIPRERLMAALDGRAWEPAQLAQLGVIDSVGYREDALRILGRLAGLGAAPPTVSLASVAQARRAWTVPARIAVVYASGEIAAGRSSSDLLNGASIGAESYARTLEEAFERRDVDAVVLRIESPGGLVNASNLMHHAAERWKTQTGKPLVVSMGSVAASGGYYIAVPADRIYADRATRTGSIGVVYVKPSLEQFYAKRGVRQEVYERGGYMRGTSFAWDWDARMQAAADSSIARSYDHFIAKVAEGRKLSTAKVREAAQGRVWTGDDAVELGLVDEIGGLEAAIAEARRRAHVPAGEKIAPAEYRRPRPGIVERVINAAIGGMWDRAFGKSAPEGPLYRADDWDVE